MALSYTPQFWRSRMCERALLMWILVWFCSCVQRGRSRTVNPIGERICRDHRPYQTNRYGSTRVLPQLTFKRWHMMVSLLQEGYFTVIPHIVCGVRIFPWQIVPICQWKPSMIVSDSGPWTSTLQGEFSLTYLFIDIEVCLIMLDVYQLPLPDLSNSKFKYLKNFQLRFEKTSMDLKKCLDVMYSLSLLRLNRSLTIFACFSLLLSKWLLILKKFKAPRDLQLWKPSKKF